MFIHFERSIPSDYRSPLCSCSTNETAAHKSCNKFLNNRKICFSSILFISKTCHCIHSKQFRHSNLWISFHFVSKLVFVVLPTYLLLFMFHWREKKWATWLLPVILTLLKCGCDILIESCTRTSTTGFTWAANYKAIPEMSTKFIPKSFICSHRCNSS